MKKKWYEYTYDGIEGDIVEEDGVYHWFSKGIRDLITAESDTIEGVIKEAQISIAEYRKLRQETDDEASVGDTTIRYVESGESQKISITVKSG